MSAAVANALSIASGSVAGWHTVVTLLLHYCYTVVILSLHCCHTVVTLERLGGGSQALLTLPILCIYTRYNFFLL
jgi:hypothetical protein